MRWRRSRNFATSSFHIVTGLLLPIWTRLPSESCRVYRLQTDEGERVIGRLVSPGWIAKTVDTEAPTLTGDDAWNALMDGRTILELTEGLELRRVRVMGEYRIELDGFTDGMVDRLKATGSRMSEYRGGDDPRRRGQARRPGFRSTIECGAQNRAVRQLSSNLARSGPSSLRGIHPALTASGSVNASRI